MPIGNLIPTLFAALLFVSLLGNSVQYGRVAELKATIAQKERDTAYAESTALRESKAEIARLTAVTEETQREYITATEALAAFRDASTAANRVRDASSANIAAAAKRISDACGNYAKDAERDLRFTEEERSRFGREAVGAAAAAHANHKTLLANRDSIAAYRALLAAKRLQPQEK